MYGGPIGTHQRSFEQYHPRPFMASPYSRLGVCNLATPSYLRNRTTGSGMLDFNGLRLRTSNLTGTFTGPIRIKVH